MPPLPSYSPPAYLRSAHLQTILNSQGPRSFKAKGILRDLRPQALTLQADDGTRLLAELDRSPSPSSRLVILLHGWEGCSTSAYMVTTTARLLAHRYDVLRVNLRDHGNTHHLNKDLFNSTRSPEVAAVVEASNTTRVTRDGLTRCLMTGGLCR